MGKFTTFEQAAERLLEKYRVPGCMIVLAKDGDIVYENTFGYRDQTKKTRINADTVFGLASLTKSFTSAAILKLAEEGKLSINDPVIHYLPELHIKETEKLPTMTLKHFMTHTSGLPPLPALDYAMVRKRNKVLSPDYGEIPKEKDLLHTYGELLDFIRKQNAALIGSPGHLFSYSNEAYSLLGAIIERVTGRTYEDYVLDEIIRPCGMERTNFLIETYQDDDNRTTCYELDDNTETLYVAEDWWDAPPMRATGFLKSTARDMMRYAQLFIHKGKGNGARILSADSIEEMLTPHVKMDPEKMYGYGFSVTEDYYGTVMIDHGGSLPSISSKFAILPEEGLSAIVLTNLSGFPAGKLLLMALNAYYDRALDADHLGFEEIAVSPALLEKYAGYYKSDEGMDCHLSVTSSGEPEFYYRGEKYPVVFVEERVFLAEIDDVGEPVEVILDEEGNVFALSIFHRILPKIGEQDEWKH